MPYKYFGRTTDFSGKSLWELLGNLRDFGIGRYVYRNVFQRYPEPSYMKILKVETCDPEPESLRKVIVWVEKVFRGKLYPEPYKIYGATYKTDYRLVPKDQEKEFCTPPQGFIETTKIFPNTISLPPLLNEVITSDLRARGEQVDGDLQIPLILEESLQNRYRLAKVGDRPNMKIEYTISREKAPNMYKDI